MKLNTVDLSRLIPSFMQDDENFKALIYAINDEFKLLYSQTQMISLYKNLDLLPESILDELAEQFSITEYNKAYSPTIKRNLIRNCLATHKRRGTVASVEDVCAKIFGDALIEEWFEYGGEPYHFKVYTENLNVSDTMIADFKRVISETKNIRSHLDELVVSAINSLDLYVGMKLSFSDDFFIESEPYDNVNVAFYIEDGELVCSNVFTPIVITLRDLSTDKVYGFIYDEENENLFLIEYDEALSITATDYHEIVTEGDGTYRMFVDDGELYYEKI